MRAALCLLLVGCASTMPRLAQVTELLAQGSLACDAGSTHTAVGRAYDETNVFMGTKPTDLAIGQYFVAVSLFLWVGNRTLPAWARVAVNAATTLIEVRAERGNASIGVPSCGL